MPDWNPPRGDLCLQVTQESDGLGIQAQRALRHNVFLTLCFPILGMFLGTPKRNKTPALRCSSPGLLTSLVSFNLNCYKIVCLYTLRSFLGHVISLIGSSPIAHLCKTTLGMPFFDMDDAVGPSTWSAFASSAGER